MPIDELAEFPRNKYLIIIPFQLQRMAVKLLLLPKAKLAFSRPNLPSPAYYPLFDDHTLEDGSIYADHPDQTIWLAITLLPNEYCTLSINSTLSVSQTDRGVCNLDESTLV